MSVTSTDSSSGFTQVGGHPGSVCGTEDGSLIIKHSSPLEREFYAALAHARVLESTSHSQSEFFFKLNKLSRFVPRFYGTLRLEGETDADAMHEGGGIVLKDVLSSAGDGGIVLKDVQPGVEVEKDEFSLYKSFVPRLTM